MSDIATTTDAKLMEGPAFVRTEPLAPLPPPIAAAGAIGWLRQNLFSSALNIALTIVCALLIVWIVPPLVKFLFIDAVWDGAEPRRLPGRARSIPRSAPAGPSSSTSINFFTYGFYPIERALAGRRVLRAAGRRRRLDGVARRAAARPRRVYFFVVMPVASLHPAARAGR